MVMIYRLFLNSVPLCPDATDTFGVILLFLISRKSHDADTQETAVMAAAAGETGVEEGRAAIN